MRPIASFPRETIGRIRGVLFDLDDTVLSHGVLTRSAFDAIWALHERKFRLVAVTGRPAAWGEIVARQWPIDAAVTENGAVAIVRSGRGLERREGCDAAERVSRRARLDALVLRMREDVPEAALTDDVHGRVSDMTWDIGERVTLPESTVQRVQATIRDSGARTTRSSVHVHATFDSDDKASGVVRLLGTMGDDVTAALSNYVFVGDSGNDAACFAAFANTVGVANVRAHVGRMSVPPRYVTTEAMGAGFAELARTLLAI